MTFQKNTDGLKLFFSSSNSDAHYISEVLKFNPIGFVFADRNYKIVQVNDSFARWSSAKSDDFVGKSLVDIFANLWLFMEPQCQRALRGDATSNQELKSVQGTDPNKTWLISYFPIQNDSDVLGFGISINDISDRKMLERHREQELERVSRLNSVLSRINQNIGLSQNREELFDRVSLTLIEQGGFPMAWVGWYSAEDKALLPNNKYQLELENRVGMKILVDRPEMASGMTIAFNSGQPYISNDMMNDPNISFWRPQYKERGFKSSASFPIKENGKIAAVMGIYAYETNFFRDKEVALLAETAQDISFALDNLAEGHARRRAESTAHEEKLFSEAMIESMPGVLYFYDEKGHFLRWNRNMERVSGYSSGEISRMHPLDFFAPESRPIIEKRIDEVFENGEAFVEAPFLTKNGHSIPYFFTGKRVTVHGIKCLVGVGIDVTDRKRAEKALQELNESLEIKVATRTKELQTALVRAESADRLKSAFLATMSHELRTPLNSIIGFTGIILQKLAGPLTDEQTKQLGMVRGSARHLLDLINDILDLSKIEANQLELRIEKFDLQESIEQTVALLKPAAEKKGLVFIYELKGNITNWSSDRRRIEQILINLINNAIKFTERGQITVSVDVITPYTNPSSAIYPSAIRVRVKDTGIGIKPEHMSLLFQPFRQIDSGLSRQHEGTGLGLTICRRLATLLGGEILASSDWPNGSEFSMIIPLKESRNA